MITKEQFKTYLEIRDSGVTNMFDVRRVVELSEGILTKKDCLEIMANFMKLKYEYSKKGT